MVRGDECHGKDSQAGQSDWLPRVSGSGEGRAASQTEKVALWLGHKYYSGSAAGQCS